MGNDLVLDMSRQCTQAPTTSKAMKYVATLSPKSVGETMWPVRFAVNTIARKERADVSAATSASITSRDHIRECQDSYAEVVYSLVFCVVA